MNDVIRCLGVLENDICVSILYIFIFLSKWYAQTESHKIGDTY